MISLFNSSIVLDTGLLLSYLEIKRDKTIEIKRDKTKELPSI